MNDEAMDDEAFVRYLKKHPDDQDGWEALLQRYHRLIWSCIPNRDTDADDLYQEIQFAIWDGLLNRYSGKGKVVSYVGGIISNKVKGRGRMQRRESLEDEFEEITGNIPDLRPTSNPEQHALHQEAAAKVAGLLQRLKPKEQKMLILQYFGYTHKEIIRILGIRSVGAARKFLSKLLNLSYFLIR